MAENKADQRSLFLRIIEQISGEFEKLRWSAGKVTADFLHTATNAEAEGVKGFPFHEQHASMIGAGNRQFMRLLDNAGYPRFRDDPILDVEGKPIANTAGDAFDVVMPASRQVFLDGQPADIARLGSVIERAGLLLSKIKTDYDDLRHGWSFSVPGHYFWFLLFEIAWRGDHPLIEARKQLWIPDSPNVHVPYDLDSLRRLNESRFLMVSEKIPPSWLTRLPDAWLSRIDDVIPACQDAWSLIESALQLPAEAQMQENVDLCAASGSVEQNAGFKMSKRFAIALSFPGQKRPFVKEVVDCLVPVVNQHRILYDDFWKVEFAVPNLDVYLPGLYRNESDLIVVFSCQEYGEREWCGLEHRAIRDLLKDNSRSPLSVLTLKFDSAKLEGELSIDGYLNASSMSPRDVADCILNRLLMCKDIGP